MIFIKEVYEYTSISYKSYLNIKQLPPVKIFSKNSGNKISFRKIIFTRFWQFQNDENILNNYNNFKMVKIFSLNFNNLKMMKS